MKKELHKNNSQLSKPVEPIEIVMAWIIIIGFILSVEMLVDIPGVDIPDIKDIPWLFPNLQ